MNLLGARLYDPLTPVAKATSALLAMTVLDATNLRVTATVPAHGLLMFRMRCVVTGATTPPTILLGVMNGTTVLGRVTPLYTPVTAPLATAAFVCVAEFVVPGLTPGVTNFDAAYGVEVLVAATNIRCGGPNNAVTADAWGAFAFEVWDPQPQSVGPQLTVDANGRVDVGRVAGTTQTARDLGANLDVAVSTRSTFAGGAVASVTAGVTVATNNDKTGYSLSTAPPTATQIRTEMDTNSTKLANLDATVSSRSTYTGADTAGTTTLLARLTATRSTNLDNLDAAVSSRSTLTAADVWASATRTLTAIADSSGVTTLLSRITGTRATLLDNLDTTVSSRSTYAGGDTAGTTTLLGRLTGTRATALDNLDATVSSRSTLTAADVWNAATRTLSDFGTLVGDIWSNGTRTLTSAPAAGDSAGVTTLLSRLTGPRANNLDNLDATVSSRSTHAAADVWTEPARTLTATDDPAGVTSLLSRLTSARADNLDYLDASVATRSTYTGLDTVGTSTLLARLTSTRAALMDNLTRLDVNVSSVSGGGGGADVSAIQAVTDKLDAMITGTAPNYAFDVAAMANVAGVMNNVTLREYLTGTAADVAVPDYFEHTPPSGKPVVPDLSALSPSELAEVNAWIDGLVPPTLPAAIAYVASYEAYMAERKAWNFADKEARIAQYLISRGDALILNKPTTSRSADLSGEGSVPPPSVVIRNDP